MTDLETRLRSLRHTPGDAPTALELRNRATRRRRHRHVSVLAVTVVGLAGAGLIAWVVQNDEPASRLTTGPRTDDDAPDAGRSLGQVDGVTVNVAPRDGIGDGDVAEVHIEGLDGLPGASIVLCAGDVTESDAASACDPGSVQQPGTDAGLPVAAVEGTQRVSLARVIRITRPSGDPNQSADYDCGTEPAGCVLAVGPYELPARAVLVPLSFEDEQLPAPSASLSQDQDLADGQEVTLVARDLAPNRTFDIRLCHISPREMCDEIGPWLSAESNQTGALEIAVPVHAALYGWQGTVDCITERCAVVVSDRGQRRLEAPVTFAAGVTAPTPQLELDPPGPYSEGQEVTIHGSGFRPGLDISGQLGQCRAHLDTAVEERCAYPSAFWGLIVDSDGAFTATFTPERSLALTGSCVGEPGCLLAWVIPHGPIGASAPLPLVP
jgi:hypothetical protein